MKRDVYGIYREGDYALKQVYINPAWQPWQIYFKGLPIDGERHNYIRDAKKRVKELAETV